MGLYVQYGCGLSAPAGWINFDASPTLRLQRLPLLGRLARPVLNVVFPDGVRYGDILRGLPGIAPGSCAGVYCSHVLEHLALQDARRALANTLGLLAPGGTFRCVVPDLEAYARRYLSGVEAGDGEAAPRFVRDTLLGHEARPRSLRERLSLLLGNAHHLWMWDRAALARELSAAGFVDLRPCRCGDAADPRFRAVEDPDRFEDAVALEARRPG